MAIRVRTVRDLEEYMSATAPIIHYFGDERDPERSERFSRQLPFDRMHAAFADGEIIAGAGVLPFELTVPGGTRRHVQA